MDNLKNQEGTSRLSKNDDSTDSVPSVFEAPPDDNRLINYRFQTLRAFSVISKQLASVESLLKTLVEKE